MIFRLSPLRHKLEEAPLMTRALKQDQAEAAYDHYDRVVIRVQFPDRLVLQACFRPRETGESDMFFISAEKCNFSSFLNMGQMLRLGQAQPGAATGTGYCVQLHRLVKEGS